MGAKQWVKSAELPHVSRWVNDDIRPIESGRRTWNYLTFQNYWLLTNCNITTYLTGSALIPLGLTWWQAFISIVLGNILATIAVVLNSLPGAHYLIGFPVFSRVVWGMWGSQFVIWNRILLSFGEYGFTAWIGGQCVYVVLLSWDPNLDEHIPNTLPAGAAMTTAQFVSYIIFSVISLPFVWIRPHKLQTFFYVTSTITITFFFVVLIWALATMGPASFGSTLSSKTELSNTGGSNSVAWLMVYGVMSTIGSIAAGILNQNDYARFATRPRHAIVGQAVAFPIYGIIPSLIGILVTAATQNRFGGESLWNLPDLFARLIKDDPSSGTRAACFFAGLALIASQVAVNVTGNALSGGFDLAATIPQYINIRRGAYITAIFSMAINPWRLVNTPGVFLTVLSSYSVFLGPMTGIMIASFQLVNKSKIRVEDLYHGGKGGIYWYTYGCNWRAFAAWTVGVAPCLPGFVSAINPSITVGEGFTELYYMNYVYGLLSSALAYTLLHMAFPAPKVATFVDEAPSSRDLQRMYRESGDANTEQWLEIQGVSTGEKLDAEHSVWEAEGPEKAA